MSAMRWWWVALTDESMPKGQQAIGAIVVLADGEAEAENKAREVARMWGYWRNPVTHFEYISTLASVDAKYGPPPAQLWTDAVLTKAQTEELAELWCGGVASPEQIKQAFLDDEAKVGDPLFKRKP